MFKKKELETPKLQSEIVKGELQEAQAKGNQFHNWAGELKAERASLDSMVLVDPIAYCRKLAELDRLIEYASMTTRTLNARISNLRDKYKQSLSYEKSPIGQKRAMAAKAVK
jgi:hypothetical protein